MKSLFSQFNSEAQKQKLENHLAIIEKGQQENLFKTNRIEIKKQIVDGINHELTMVSRDKNLKVIGSLAPIFGLKSAKFTWPQEILKKVLA